MLTRRALLEAGGLWLEAVRMVGRLVVGRPGGPSALPFDYFKGRSGTGGWKPVPRPAQAAFPSVGSGRVVCARSGRR